MQKQRGLPNLTLARGQKAQRKPLMRSGHVLEEGGASKAQDKGEAPTSNLEKGLKRRRKKASKKKKRKDPLFYNKNEGEASNQ